MKFLQRIVLGLGIAALLAQPLASRADVASNATPDFKDVYDLIANHLTGEGASDLNRDAVQGLLTQLHGKVSLIASKGDAAASTNEMALAKSSVFDGPIGYMRVGRVSAGLASQITAAYKELSATNQLKGLVLDLRNAEGDDYAEAAAVADLFISKERPLLDWGKGVVQSKEKTNALNLTLVALINAKTSGAAEAVAAVLREDERAILLGGNSAGDAAISQEFPLKNGDHLRIATSPIKVGDGESLSAKGVAPDIHVVVKPEDEQIYLNDPFRQIGPGGLAGGVGDVGTNHIIGRPHQLNEADLMRARKEKPGVDMDNLSAASLEPRDHEKEIEKPIVRDPVLARALDLIKGISVMRHSHLP